MNVPLTSSSFCIIIICNNLLQIQFKGYLIKKNEILKYIWLIEQNIKVYVILYRRTHHIYIFFISMIVFQQWANSMLHICLNANPCGNAFLWELHNISKWSEVCIKQTNPITLRPQVDCFSRYNQARMQDACWSWNPFRLPFSSLDCLRVCLPWIYPWQFINIGPRFVVNILTWKLNCHLSL